MLIAQSSAYPGFRFLRGVTVTDLIRRQGRVAGVLLRGDAQEELRADLVVGTDGRASVVRKKLALEHHGDAQGFDVVWFKVPLPVRLRTAAVQVYVRPGQACLAFPTFDDRLQVGWIIPKGSYGDLKRRGSDDWLEAIAAQVGPELAAHLIEHREVLERPFVLDVVCYHLERWQRPGALLLGDAAHPMSPVGGQGLNIALRDAIVAANHLVPLLQADAEPEALDACAEAIQAERLTEVAEVQRLQRIPPRIFFRRGLWVRALLGIGALLLRLPALPRRARPPAIARSFLHGVSPVELRV
jgi:2-polyprenyl-6-methoxyphenol hydroxylase-like FAD-dependent oxidoreductase